MASDLLPDEWQHVYILQRCWGYYQMMESPESYALWNDVRVFVYSALLFSGARTNDGLGTIVVICMHCFTTASLNGWSTLCSIQYRSQSTDKVSCQILFQALFTPAIQSRCQFFCQTLIFIIDMQSTILSPELQFSTASQFWFHYQLLLALQLTCKTLLLYVLWWNVFLCRRADKWNIHEWVMCTISRRFRDNASSQYFISVTLAYVQTQGFTLNIHCKLTKL